jgi:hypothetical protein
VARRIIGILLLVGVLIFIFRDRIPLGVDIPFQLIYAVLGVGVVITVYDAVRSRARSKQIPKLGTLLSLEYTKETLFPEDQDFCDLGFFKRGYWSTIRNTLRGRDEWLFDYSFHVRGRRNRISHSVAVFRLSRARLPRFELRPEDVLAKLAVVLGGQDVDFAEDPEFSKHFRLTCGDEEEVRKLFNTMLRTQLKSCDLSCEGESKWLVIYSKGVVSAGKLSEFFDTARRLAREFERSARTLKM